MVNPDSAPQSGADPAADPLRDVTQLVHNVSPYPVGFGGGSDIYTGYLGPTKVAIKAIRVRPGAAGDIPKILRREISAWKRLKHDNVQPMYGLYTGFPTPVPAMVSPWYENGDINAFLKARKDDLLIDVIKLNLLTEATTAVVFLHDHKIVHGDIKGANVLVSDDGRAKLTDFGLSRILAEHSGTTTEDAFCRGTIRWMAPELVHEEGTRASYASDIWACGCLIIEVWGSAPYHTKTNSYQVMSAIRNGEGPPRPDNMPDFMWNLVARCCNFTAGERPPPSQLTAQLGLRVRLCRMIGIGYPLDAAGAALLKGLAYALSSVQPSDLHILTDTAMLTFYCPAFTLDDCWSYLANLTALSKLHV